MFHKIDKMFVIMDFNYILCFMEQIRDLNQNKLKKSSFGIANFRNLQRYIRPKTIEDTQSQSQRLAWHFQCDINTLNIDVKSSHCVRISTTCSSYLYLYFMRNCPKGPRNTTTWPKNPLILPNPFKVLRFSQNFYLAQRLDNPINFQMK